MPTIAGERVLADLKRLAEFGCYKTGVTGRLIRRSISSRVIGWLESLARPGSTR
jgi:hypothetical protein